MTPLPERIDEAPNLLDEMLADADAQEAIYQPGPYWRATAQAAASDIRRYGLNDFRGSSNLIGMSYADPLVVDWRLHLRAGIVKRLFGWVTTRLFPLSRVYENQVSLTQSFAARAISLAEEILNSKGRTAELLRKYKVPYSLLGGCLEKVKIGQDEISIHYLNLLSQHDYAADIVDFRSAKSLFEIGGGFGLNVHLLLTNYPNIRKVIYLDIPPNLYVGTQYLRAFYGSAVIDYNEVKRRKSLAFCEDDSIEILCIAPWQIEFLEKEADLLFNSHSFVEMPKEVVKNYANKAVGRFASQKSAVVLVSYTGGDVTTTLDPDDLPAFFGTSDNFIRFRRDDLMLSKNQIAYYISPGKLGKR